MTGHELRRELAERGILAVVRAGSADRAVAAGNALAEGSVTAIEVTFTVPDAVLAIARLAADDSLLVGAGTVLTPDQAAAAVQAGARFVVSPHLDERVLDAAEELGVPALPGVFTPTEVARAMRRCSLVKLFPASLGGPALLSALRGPFPDLAAIPTGGVDTRQPRRLACRRRDRRGRRRGSLPARRRRGRRRRCAARPCRALRRGSRDGSVARP